MLTAHRRCWTILIVVPLVWSAPLSHDIERPLNAVSELTSAVSGVGSRVASRLQDRERDQRLLPTPQDLETIRKVAQILVMLGEQVIPPIIGEPPRAPPPACPPPLDVPNDPVDS